MQIYFAVTTPLGITVTTTKSYWNYLVEKKHPQMKEKESIVKDILNRPEEVRRSIIDRDVYLYYKTFDRLYCVVAKQLNKQGFLITAYPTDKVKEGEVIWTG